MSKYDPDSTLLDILSERVSGSALGNRKQLDLAKATEDKQFKFKGNDYLLNLGQLIEKYPSLSTGQIQDFVSRQRRMNSSAWEDFVTAVDIALSDNLLAMGYGFVGLTSGNKFFLNEALNERKQAELKAMNYSAETQAQLQDINDRYDARKAAYTEQGDSSFMQMLKQAPDVALDYFSNNRALMTGFGENIDSLLTSPVGGFIAGNIAKAGAKKAAFKMLSKEGLEKGITKEVAERLGSAKNYMLAKKKIEQAQKSIVKSQIKAGTAYSMFDTFIGEGASGGINSYKEVMDMPIDEFKETEAYKNAKKSNPKMSDNEIQESVALSSGRITGAITGLGALALAKITGSAEFEGNLLNRVTTKEAKKTQAEINKKIIDKALKKEEIKKLNKDRGIISNLTHKAGRGIRDAGKSIIKGTLNYGKNTILKRGGLEGLEEAGTSLIGGTGANIVAKTLGYDSDREAFEDLGMDIGASFAIGSVTGAATDTVGIAARGVGKTVGSIKRVPSKIKGLFSSKDDDSDDNDYDDYDDDYDNDDNDDNDAPSNSGGSFKRARKNYESTLSQSIAPTYYQNNNGSQSSESTQQTQPTKEQVKESAQSVNKEITKDIDNAFDDIIKNSKDQDLSEGISDYKNALDEYKNTLEQHANEIAESAEKNLSSAVESLLAFGSQVREISESIEEAANDENISKEDRQRLSNLATLLGNKQSKSIAATFNNLMSTNAGKKLLVIDQRVQALQEEKGVSYDDIDSIIESNFSDEEKNISQEARDALIEAVVAKRLYSKQLMSNKFSYEQLDSLARNIKNKSLARQIKNVSNWKKVRFSVLNSNRDEKGDVRKNEWFLGVNHHLKNIERDLLTGRSVKKHLERLSFFAKSHQQKLINLTSDFKIYQEEVEAWRKAGEPKGKSPNAISKYSKNYSWDMTNINATKKLINEILPQEIGIIHAGIFQAKLLIKDGKFEYVKDEGYGIKSYFDNFFPAKHKRSTDGSPIREFPKTNSTQERKAPKQKLNIKGVKTNGKPSDPVNDTLQERLKGLKANDEIPSTQTMDDRPQPKITLKGAISGLKIDNKKPKKKQKPKSKGLSKEEKLKKKEDEYLANRKTLLDEKTKDLTDTHKKIINDIVDSQFNNRKANPMSMNALTKLIDNIIEVFNMDDGVKAKKRATVITNGIIKVMKKEIDPNMHGFILNKIISGTRQEDSNQTVSKSTESEKDKSGNIQSETKNFKNLSNDSSQQEVKNLSPEDKDIYDFLLKFFNEKYFENSPLTNENVAKKINNSKDSVSIDEVIDALFGVVSERSEKSDIEINLPEQKQAAKDLRKILATHGKGSEHYEFAQFLYNKENFKKINVLSYTRKGDGVYDNFVSFIKIRNEWANKSKFIQEWLSEQDIKDENIPKLLFIVDDWISKKIDLDKAIERINNEVSSSKKYKDETLRNFLISHLAPKNIKEKQGSQGFFDKYTKEERDEIVKLIREASLELGDNFKLSALLEIKYKYINERPSAKVMYSFVQELIFDHVRNPKNELYSLDDVKNHKGQIGPIDASRFPKGSVQNSKDRKKQSVSDSFIGFGFPNTSTGIYQSHYGNLANKGVYFENEIVFISSMGGEIFEKHPLKGKARYELVREWQEHQMKLAMNAGAVFITDAAGKYNREYVKKGWSKPYNLGEIEVAEFLQSNGYIEYRVGSTKDSTAYSVWKKGDDFKPFTLSDKNYSNKELEELNDRNKYEEINIFSIEDKNIDNAFFTRENFNRIEEEQRENEEALEKVRIEEELNKIEQEYKSALDEINNYNINKNKQLKGLKKRIEIAQSKLDKSLKNAEHHRGRLLKIKSKDVADNYKQKIKLLERDVENKQKILASSIKEYELVLRVAKTREREKLERKIEKKQAKAINPYGFDPQDSFRGASNNHIISEYRKHTESIARLANNIETRKIIANLLELPYESLYAYEGDYDLGYVSLDHEYLRRKLINYKIEDYKNFIKTIYEQLSSFDEKDSKAIQDYFSSQSSELPIEPFNARLSSLILKFQTETKGIELPSGISEKFKQFANEYRFMSNIVSVKRENTAWHEVSGLERLREIASKDDFTKEEVEQLFKELLISHQDIDENDMNQIIAMQEKRDWFNRQILDIALLTFEVMQNSKYENNTNAARHPFSEFVHTHEMVDGKLQKLTMPDLTDLTKDEAKDAMRDFVVKLVDPQILDAMFIAYVQTLGIIGSNEYVGSKELQIYLGLSDKAKLQEIDKSNLLSQLGTLSSKNFIKGIVTTSFGLRHSDNLPLNVSDHVYEVITKIIRDTLDMDPDIYVKRAYVGNNLHTGYSIIIDGFVGDKTVEQVDQSWIKTLRRNYSDQELAKFEPRAIAGGVESLKKRSAERRIANENMETLNRRLAQSNKKTEFAKYTYLGNNIVGKLAGSNHQDKKTVIGEPSKPLQQGARSSSGELLSREQIDAENIARAIPRQLNLPLLSLYEKGVGEDHKLFNGLDVNESTDWMNRHEVDSRDGLDIRLSYSVNKAIELRDRIDKYEEKHGLTGRKTRFFFDASHQRTSRSQNQGYFNDMNYKFHRALSVMENTPLINNFNPFLKKFQKSQTQQERYWLLSIGFNLFGKGDKQDNDITIKSALDVLAGKDDLLKDENGNQKSALPLIKAIAKNMDKNGLFIERMSDETFKEFSDFAKDNYEKQAAIVELAVIYKMTGDGGRNKITFKPTLRIEMDGITNGPFHAAVSMGISTLNYTDIVKRMKKSGVTKMPQSETAIDSHTAIGISNENKALKRDGKNYDKDSIYDDTYVTISEQTQSAVRFAASVEEDEYEDIVNSNISENKKSAIIKRIEKNQAMRNFLFSSMDQILEIKQIKDKNDNVIRTEYTILRNGSKNPVTMTVYGAGRHGLINGIFYGAGQGVEGLKSYFYKDLTEALKTIEKYLDGDITLEDFDDILSKLQNWALLSLENSDIDIFDKKANTGFVPLDAFLGIMQILESTKNLEEVVDNNRFINALSKIQNYSINPDHKDEIVKNIENVYTKHLIEAIDSYFEDTKRASAQAIALSDFLNDVANTWFEDMYEQLKTIRVNEGLIGDRDSLSRSDVNFIFSKLRHRFPTLELREGQEIDLSNDKDAKKRKELSNQDFNKTAFLARRSRRGKERKGDKKVEDDKKEKLPYTNTTFNLQPAVSKRGRIGVKILPLSVIPIDAHTQNLNHLMQGSSNQIYLNMLDAFDQGISANLREHSEISNAAEYISYMTADPLQKYIDAIEQSWKLLQEPIHLGGSVAVHSPLKTKVKDSNGFGEYNLVHPAFERLYQGLVESNNNILQFYPSAYDSGNINEWFSTLLKALKVEQAANLYQRINFFSDGVLFSGDPNHEPEKVYSQQMAGINGGGVYIVNGKLELTKEAYDLLSERGKRIVEEFNDEMENLFTTEMISKAASFSKNPTANMISSSYFHFLYDDYRLSGDKEQKNQSLELTASHVNAAVSPLMSTLRKYGVFKDGKYTLSNDNNKLESFIVETLGISPSTSTPISIDYKDRDLARITSKVISSLGIGSDQNSIYEDTRDGVTEEVFEQSSSVKQALKSLLKDLTIEISLNNDFEDNEYGDFKVKDGKPVIRIKAGMSPEKTAITLAHELHHAYMYHGVLSGSTDLINMYKYGGSIKSLSISGSFAFALIRQIERFIQTADPVLRNTEAYKRISYEYEKFAPIFEKIRKNPNSIKEEDAVFAMYKMIQEYMAEMGEVMRRPDIKDMSFFFQTIDQEAYLETGITPRLREHIQGLLETLFEYLRKLFGFKSKEEYAQKLISENPTYNARELNEDGKYVFEKDNSYIIKERNLLESAATHFINRNMSRKKDKDLQIKRIFSLDERDVKGNDIIKPSFTDIFEDNVNRDLKATEQEKSIYRGALHEISNKFLRRIENGDLSRTSMPYLKIHSDSFFETMYKAGLNKGATFEYVFDLISSSLNFGAQKGWYTRRLLKELQEEARKQIKPNEFASALGLEDGSNDLYDVLFNPKSNVSIAHFAAFARLVPEFKELIDGVRRPPQKRPSRKRSLYKKITDAIHSAFKSIALKISKLGPMDQSVSKFTARLHNSAGIYSQSSNRKMRTLEDNVDKFIQKVGRKTLDKSVKLASMLSPTGLGGTLKRINKGAGFSKVIPKALRDTGKTRKDKLPNTFIAAANLFFQKPEMHSRDILSHQSATIQLVDNTAKNRESSIYKELVNGFKTKLSKDDKEALHYWVKIDAGSLFDNDFTQKDVLDLLKNEDDLQFVMDSTIEEIQQIVTSKRWSNFVINESLSLGSRLITGGTHKGLNLSNSWNIVNIRSLIPSYILNEKELSENKRMIRSLESRLEQISRNRGSFINDDHYEREYQQVASQINDLSDNYNLHDSQKQVDILITLKAIQALPQREKGKLISLLESEINLKSNGMQNVFNVIKSNTAKLKKTQIRSDVDQLLPKGYSPEIYNSDAILKVIEKKDLKKNHGFKVVKELGDGRVLVFSRMGSHQKFVQGALSTIETSIGGWSDEKGIKVDSVSLQEKEIIYTDEAAEYLIQRFGKTIDDIIPYLFQEKILEAVKLADKGIIDDLGEPEFNDSIQIINDRAIVFTTEIPNSFKNKYLDLEKDGLAEVARHSARITQQSTAIRQNEKLIDLLNSQYLSAGVTERKSFIKVHRDSKNPIIKELYKLIPEKTKKYIQKTSPYGLYIHKADMYDALGFRSLSVKDLWKSDKKFAKEFVRYMELFLGKDAINKLRYAEKLLNGSVQSARKTIAIKSIDVPAGNAVSNLIQLVSFGVSIKRIFHDSVQAIVAVREFDKTIEQLFALRARMKANRTVTKEDYLALDSIKSELYSNPITKLVEAGLRPTIVEDILTGSKDNEFEKLFSKLNNYNGFGAETIKSLLITDDSPSFQLLSDFVSNSDLAAKFVLYNKLVEEDGMSDKDAKQYVMDNFVNYQRVKNPTLGYLEDIGLYSFFQFFITAQRIIFSMIQQYPTRFFITFLFSGITGFPSIFDGWILIRDVMSTVGLVNLYEQAFNAYPLSF